jgi:hypothetical protein
MDYFNIFYSLTFSFSLPSPVAPSDRLITTILKKSFLGQNLNLGISALDFTIFSVKVILSLWRNAEGNFNLDQSEKIELELRFEEWVRFANKRNIRRKTR